MIRKRADGRPPATIYIYSPGDQSPAHRPRVTDITDRSYSLRIRVEPRRI